VRSHLDGHRLAVEDADQIAIDLGEKRSTSTRQQVVHVRCLGWMARHENGRPARQVDERAQHACVITERYVVVLIIARVVGRAGINNEQAERSVLGGFSIDAFAYFLF
jgi:hypothetical protein